MSARHAARQISGLPVSRSESERVVLGLEIRKLRKARGKSLAELALAIGRSISFVSQLERGNAELSIGDLRRVAVTLGVPLGWFFVSEQTPGEELGRIVRADSRRRLGDVTDGLVEELLSPNIGGAFETFLSTFAAGSKLDSFVQRETEEEGYLVKGSLDIWIGSQFFRLNMGDSFRIENAPFRWENNSKEESVVVWVISPPTY